MKNKFLILSVVCSSSFAALPVNPFVVNSGDKYTANLNIEQNETLTNNGTISVLGTAISSGGAVNANPVTIINSGIISGNIDLSAAPGGGGINFTHSGLIIGNYLGSLNAATTLNIGDVNTTTGGNISGTIDGNNANSVINVDRSFSTSGNITNFNNLTVNNASTVFNINNNVTLGGVLNNNGVINLNNNANVNVTGIFTNSNYLNLNGGSISNITNNGVVSLNENTTLTGLYNQGANGVLNITVDKLSPKKIQATGALPALSGVLNLKIKNYFYKTGDFIGVLSGTVAATTPTFTVKGTNGSLVFNPANNANSPNDASIQATRISYDKIVKADNVRNMGDALIEVGALNQLDAGKVLAELDMIIDKEEIKNGLNELKPDTTDSFSNLLLIANQQGVTLINNRLSQLRQDIKSYVSGDEFVAVKSFWARGYGSAISQKKIDAYNGYKAGIGGTAFGVDKILYPGWIFGFGGNYSRARIKLRQDSLNLTKINTYQALFYNNIEYKVGMGKYYINNVLSYAFNQFRKEREINVGAFNSKAHASHNGGQYGVSLESGYSLVYKNIGLNPLVKFDYIYSRQQAYEERIKDANSLSLVLNRTILQKMDLGGGVRFTVNHEPNKIISNWRFIYTHTLKVDAQENFAQFLGGGPFFEIIGKKPTKKSFLIGFGIGYKPNKNLELELNYDMTRKVRYFEQTGYINLKYLF